MQLRLEGSMNLASDENFNWKVKCKIEEYTCGNEITWLRTLWFV